MSLKLNGATSGSVELDVPDDIGSDLNVTLPATAGEVAVKDSNGNLELTSINSLNYPTAGPLSNRNLIINGAMRVAQRSTSVTGLGDNDSGYHTVDRFRFTEGGTPAYELTMAQSTDAPTGFSNSLRLDTTTAQASPNVNDQLRIEYKVEGQDLQPLAYGTASAKSFTLSFWVKSNVTGDYVVWFRNHDNTASCRHLYTINSSGVWEYKTITVLGDTANAFLNNINTALSLSWILSAGSNFTSGTGSQTWVPNITATHRYVGQTANIVASTDNDWSITGVQLEVGSKATPFEHRSYGDELQRCQRYYYRSDLSASSGAYGYFGMPIATATDICVGAGTFPVTMRLAPDVEIPFGYDQSGITVGGAATAGVIGVNGFVRINNPTGSFSTNGTPVTAPFTASAEL